MPMANFDVFISHSSNNKELARLVFYNGISNGLRPWFDEALLLGGDHVKQEICRGINDSRAYLLFHSKEAMAAMSWVHFEMDVAKEKKERDSDFRIIVVKLDDINVQEWWNDFLYVQWNSSDQPGSIISLIEAILNRKIFTGITGAAFLTSAPASVCANRSASLAEHTRNYILYYMAHVKQLLQAVITTGIEAEHQDTLTKLLKLSLLKQLPSLQGGWMPCAPGEYEFIHANRTRCPPKIIFAGLPTRYEYKIIHNDEVSTRVSFYEIATGELVRHPVPFSAVLDSRL